MGDGTACLIFGLIALPFLIKAAIEDIRRIRRYGWPSGSARGSEFITYDMLDDDDW